MDFSHVSLAFCHPHDYSGYFGAFVWRTVAEHPGLDVIDLGSGPMIASARNEMALQFMDRRSEWMLMVDADMSAPPDTLDRMLCYADRHDTPILGGLCFIVGRLGKIEPTLRVTDTENGGLKTIWDYPEDTLLSVDATGGAFLMIHRSVFEKLWETYKEHPYPFFAESTHGGFSFGEDVTFCLRARNAGFPVKVHTGIEIGHVKPYVYGSYDYREYRRQVALVGEEEYARAYVARQGLMRVEAPVPQVSRRERRQQGRLARRQ